MSHRRLSAALLFTSAFAMTQAASVGAQAVQKSMFVSVVNQAGAPVPNLTPSDFIVREDNVSREVLRVAPADEPMQVAVLVDTSSNARRDVAYIKDALPGLVKTLTAGQKNQVALVAFGQRPTILADFSSRTADVEKGLTGVWAISQTGATFLDAVLEVSQGFKKREARRPVIVAVVSEGPEASFRYYDQVLGPLRASGAALHVVMIGTPFLASTDEARSRNIVLDEGTRTTGGSRLQLLTGQALTSKLAQLADVLTHQYRVTYARPQSLIPPEKVAVSAKNHELTAYGTLANDQGKP
jgi:hypothetical protein